MVIELSTITFTNGADIVPVSGKQEILNTGMANTLAGDDTLTGIGLIYDSDPSWIPYGISNSGTLDTAEDNDIITGKGFFIGIENSGTFSTAEGNDIINAEGFGFFGNGFSNSGTFNTGEGDDTIGGSGYGSGLGNSGTFNTGEGDDRIGGGGGKGGGLGNSGTFITADGNDTISGGGYSGGITISESGILDTGNGNDRISGYGTFGDGLQNRGLINTGNGKDAISGSVDRIPYRGISNFSTIDTGNDDDIISAGGGIDNYGNIDIGDGDDSIIAGISYSSDVKLFNNLNDIETGNGNDIIKCTLKFHNNDGSSISNKGIAMYNGGTINTGNGNDIIDCTALIYDSYDTLTDISEGVSNYGTINTGNDQDSILSVGNFTNRGGVFLGEGNDLIAVSSIAGVDLPNPTLSNFNAIETGEGDDIITSVGVIYNEGIINTGDGNDSIIANDGFQSAPNSNGTWFLGEGEDYIKGFGNGDFFGGNGNDTLELTPGTYTVEIWGEGGELPVFTKGNQLMITSEFEKLKAGNILYDFTSLTAGQIITVA